MPIPGFLLAAGLLAGFLAAISRAHAAEQPAAAPAVAEREHLKKILATKDPKKIAAASLAAREAGHTDLAAQLARHARGAALALPNASYKSPFPKIPDDAWTKYVRMMRGPSAQAITPGYHLGLFGFGMRRLVDLGLATNPHRTQYKNAAVWDADWIPSLQPGPQKFLADPELQYQTFVKMTIADARWIAQHARDAIGMEIEGKQATLSGLLAVCKQTGMQGLTVWLTEEAARKKYPSTISLFQKTTGVF